jgi:predicted phosphodiesterase
LKATIINIERDRAGTYPTTVLLKVVLLAQKEITMKFAIISDTHLGDPDSVLFLRNRNDEFVPGPKYQQFVKEAGKGNDYLILLGDIMDFSIRSYDEAYKIARAFFLQVQKDKIADQMIYIPGNHDEDIWHTVEYEVNIMDRINKGKIPQKFKMSLPGVIDDRSSLKKERLLLPGVDEIEIEGKIGYGGLFLDKITGKGERQTRFNFVYPNLYVASDSGSVLITHGHYFETYWSLLSEWAPEIFENDLAVAVPMVLKEMVSINFPMNQFSCSGVGQAGKLTDTIRKLQIDIRNHNLEFISQYLDRLVNKIAKNLIWKLVWKWVVKKQVLGSLGQVDDARYDKEFMNRPDVQNRFKRFYQRSCEEIKFLNKKYGYDLPMPQVVIFGHTHWPVAWDSGDLSVQIPGEGTIRLFNSGGWLTRTLDAGTTEFCGAEVFKYETGSGFSSASIE